jgi:predicted amidohydrolase YtcJ
LYDDGAWAERILGKNRKSIAFPIGSLLRSGAKVAFGSDWFVAPPSPLRALYAAVTRRTAAGTVWGPEEAISIEEGLKCYTLYPAYAEFSEDRKGKLAEGFLADFVLLDQNILHPTFDPLRLWDMKVLATFVNGNLVYDQLSTPLHPH